MSHEPSATVVYNPADIIVTPATHRMQHTFNASQQNLQRLLIIRAIMLVLQWCALVWGSIALPSALPVVPLAITLGISTLLIPAALWRLQRARVVHDTEFFAHLLADVTLLSIVLYFSGGATNPFASFYLVPLSISAAILSARYTWILAGMSLIAYSIMLFAYQPIEWLAPEHHHHGNTLSPHILGMWAIFSISAVLITYFVSHMASSLRKRTAELVAVREQRLRDEQLLGIATLAAGTVHELGTPLATMAILAETLCDTTQPTDAVHTDAMLLTQQIQVCKTILRNLANAAEQQKSGATQRINAAHFVQHVITHWQLLRPEVPIKAPLHSDAATTAAINADTTLEQAIINILNNAADASPAGIELTLLNEHDTVVLTIRDHGHGLAHTLDNIGTPFVSSKGTGRGLGLFLSNAAIERLGGSVMLHNHPDGGALALIRLPMAHD